MDMIKCSAKELYACVCTQQSKIYFVISLQFEIVKCANFLPTVQSDSGSRNIRTRKAKSYHVKCPKVKEKKDPIFFPTK